MLMGKMNKVVMHTPKGIGEVQPTASQRLVLPVSIFSMLTSLTRCSMLTEKDTQKASLVIYVSTP